MSALVYLTNFVEFHAIAKGINMTLTVFTSFFNVYLIVRHNTAHKAFVRSNILTSRVRVY